MEPKPRKRMYQNFLGPRGQLGGWLAHNEALWQAIVAL